ncbi:MAG: hypothetical protein R3E50_13340 [Halioglobus sp.]
MSRTPANIGLVLPGPARDSVVAALARAGYEVHVAVSAERVRTMLARGSVDAWIFDARSEDILEVLLTSGSYLLPADNIPSPAHGVPFSLWVEGLLTQLAVALSGHGARSGSGEGWRDVRGVWLLAGSAGATAAIQEFLGAFRQPPPVAFLYAQHLDPGQHQQRVDLPCRTRSFPWAWPRACDAAAGPAGDDLAALHGLAQRLRPADRDPRVMGRGPHPGHQRIAGDSQCRETAVSRCDHLQWHGRRRCRGPAHF